VRRTERESMNFAGSIEQNTAGLVVHVGATFAWQSVDDLIPVEITAPMRDGIALLLPRLQSTREPHAEDLGYVGQLDKNDDGMSSIGELDSAPAGKGRPNSVGCLERAPNRVAS
jgi:hypothetical protein